MSKKSDIEQLTNLMSKALRHRIGSIVNEDEIYAARYAKDAETIMKAAEKIVNNWNWNNYDKGQIKEKLRKKLEKELTEKDFLSSRKFEIMDEEINKALKKFNLN